MNMKRIILLICIFGFVNAAVCGRFSDNCAMAPNQDIDYVFYADALGRINKIEMQGFIPSESTCKGSHLYGNIYTTSFSAVEKSKETYEFDVRLDAIYLIVWDLNAFSEFKCNRTISPEIRYNVMEIDCFKDGENIIGDLRDMIGMTNHVEFTDLGNNQIEMGRTIYTLENSDGCFLGLLPIYQIIGWITLICLLVVLALVIVFICYKSKEVKTLAGDKVNMIKTPKKEMKEIKKNELITDKKVTI
ncbi:hypothetical protein WA158_004981 [Blastocystis sp. Blastoise]